jgi:hypothetical protein
MILRQHVAGDICYVHDGNAGDQQLAALRAISGQHPDTFTGFFSLRQGISQTHGVLPQCGKLYFP